MSASLPVPTSPFIIYNTELLQDVSSKVRYLGNNGFEKETSDLALDAWFTELVKDIHVTRPVDSRIMNLPAGYSVIFPLRDDIIQLATDDYVVNLL